jgi:glycine dehydrogenase
MSVEQIKERAESKKINLRYYDDNQHVGISLDETVTPNDLKDLFEIFNCDLKAVIILVQNIKM